MTLFTPVVQGRISEMIAEQVRGLIRAGKLRPGDRLPSERELCQQFGVSRVTVRDALRMLEGAGLIDSRVGAKGGAFVRTPTASQVGDGIADMVTMAGLGANEVTEARLVLELGIIPFVCERATEQDVADLQDICAMAKQALKDGHHDLGCSAAFHTRFAQAGHNRALDLLVESFQVPLRVSLEQAQSSDPKMGRLGVNEHVALVNAVIAKDVEGAKTIMARHLGRTARRVGRAAGSALEAS